MISDEQWFTISHRRKCERRCYSFGYRTTNYKMLQKLAREEANSGEYSCVKIIDANTCEDLEYFTKTHR